MKKDTIKELTLQVHNEKKVNNVCRELVLCFENQFGIKEKLSDKNAWRLHRIMVYEVKDE